jgi:transposase
MIGLLSLRALDGSQASRIWPAAEATDMRCGFDRLAERVRVIIGHLFVFRSRLGDRPSFCILLQNPGSLRVLFS